MNPQNKLMPEKSTREQIIEYSADLLRSRGFDGFSYLDISRQFGITKASVHHHFPKKEDLGLALCDWTREWLEKGLTNIDESSTSQWHKLQQYQQAAKKHVLSENKLCPISAFYNDLNKLADSIKEKLCALDELELNWVTQVITDGINNKEFIHHKDARAMAGIFIFSCKGTLYYARNHGETLFQHSMQQFKELLLIEI